MTRSDTPTPEAIANSAHEHGNCALCDWIERDRNRLLAERAGLVERCAKVLQDSKALLQQNADMLFDSGTAMDRDEPYWDGSEPEQEALWREHIDVIQRIDTIRSLALDPKGEAVALQRTWTENKCGDKECEEYRRSAAIMVLTGGATHKEHAEKVYVSSQSVAHVNEMLQIEWDKEIPLHTGMRLYASLQAAGERE